MYNENTIKNIPAYVICLDRKREERCDKTMPKKIRFFIQKPKD